MAHHLILFAILLLTAGCSALHDALVCTRIIQRKNSFAKTYAENIWTLNHVTVRQGGTVTLPCLYDSRYELNPKYWCTGLTWGLCTINAHTNRNGKWLLTDDPSQNIFTVELKNLTTSDSGNHWCAVEISKQLDLGELVYLTVKAVPDVSVVSSTVSGHEGGNVSIRCFYSSTFKNKHKEWCRLLDKSCYTVGKTGTSQNTVQISDDERESFTVVMSGLMLSDSGWYYCSVGDLQAPVQLFVQYTNTSKNSNQSLDNATSPLEDNKYPSNGILVLLSITGPLLLLMLMVAFYTWRIKRKHRPDPNSMADDSTSLWYGTVVFKKAKDDKEDDHISIPCAPDRDNDTVYSTVKRL